MKKILLLPVIAALCAAEFGAFAAPVRGRGTSASAANNAGTAPVSARAASTRGQVKQAPASAKQNAAAPATQGVAARAAKKQGVVSSGVAPVSARAASTQKVLNASTKIATASENTAVPQECQDFFFGCMDAFCMLDNASGGRCQCNDRVTELDKVLEEITKLDEQSYLMATEGVERLQMGENADEIMARAKAASESVVIKEQQKKEETKKKRTLDLSAWNNVNFDDVDDVFGESSKSEEQVLEDFVNKRGDELYKASAKMCGAQIPEQCKSYSAMLQGVYQQKIRSDCSAYENGLKQQRNASQQKLRTAQAALREAALESFENENKYADAGSCVVAFKQCMQTTGECGSDFSGCIADNATLNALYKNTKSTKVATVKLTDAISISKATYDIVSANALKCESVVRQCVNANGGKDLTSGKILPLFIKDIAPTLYATEYQMASDARMNCISTIVKCVKTSCKSAGFEEGSDNYDACLSNPDSIKNYCALEIPKCGDTLSQNDVVSYVMAKLAADRVDKCTEEVKTCLQKEDHCGENYANCIGLDTDTILDFCPAESLMACQDKHKTDKAEVRNYVARVAQGLALSIDNAQQEACQKAVDDAMIKYCGDVNSCPNLSINENMFKGYLQYQLCENGTENCWNSVAGLDDDQVLDGKINPRVTGLISLSAIDYDETKIDDANEDIITPDTQYNRKVKKALGYTVERNNVVKLTDIVNRAYRTQLSMIESDPKVDACLKGKTIQGISSSDKPNAEIGRANIRFTNLTQNVRMTLLDAIMDKVSESYQNAVKEIESSDVAKKMQEDLDAKTAEALAKKAADEEAIKEQFENILDSENDKLCQENYVKEADFSRREANIQTEKHSAAYNTETNVCTETIETYICKNSTPKKKCKKNGWDLENPSVKVVEHKMEVLTKDVETLKKAREALSQKKSLDDVKSILNINVTLAK